MKISFHWLKDYIDIRETPAEIADLLTFSGLEVEHLEEYQTVKGGLEGLVIGEVLTCQPHPNADKLSLATVDIGKDEALNIVCGAPNVASGQKVVVAPVNTTIFPTEGEPFKIKKAKIRGEVSEGMICAEDEIGLGTAHDGILVLDTELPNGIQANKYFQISSDHILEIGLTPNRADAASHLGVARDLKALLDREVKWPQVDRFSVDSQERNIKVTVENPEACPRYSGLTISSIQVKDSPDWLKTKLASIGLSPVNNVVDATNFVLHEMGQPLHAFDADEITGEHVIVKTLAPGSKFTTLDEEERTLQGTDLMICNEKEGMCIAGVFGGVKSGIKATTKNVFLESAYFSPDYIRRTAQHHQLKTDASFRYERGTDPNITVIALKRAAILIRELAGGSISSEVIDVYPKPIDHLQVPVKYAHINRLIGKAIPKETTHSILSNLEIGITAETTEGFIASVPPYRVDVEREADIIEEVLRIYGFNNVALPPYPHSEYLAEFPEKDPDQYRKIIGQLLAGNGFQEIITNSLTKPGYAEKASFLDPSHSVEVLNKLSEDLAVLRQSLLFSGLEVIAHNINRKQKDLKLFEFGKTYRKVDGQYIEKQRLAIFLTGNLEPENWIHKEQKIEFHNLYASVVGVIQKLSMSDLETSTAENEGLEYGINIFVDREVAATLGKVKPTLIREFDFDQEIFFADLDWDLLLQKTSDIIAFEEVPKFPEVRRDLSLVIDKNVTFEEIKRLARKKEKKLLVDINLFDVYEGGSIGKNKKAYALSFILQDREKTLTDKIIDKTMNRLMHSFENELNALIRK